MARTNPFADPENPVFTDTNSTGYPLSTFSTTNSGYWNHSST
ncbi:hypothetical protein B9479_006368, partial [Cryptococcus floricola]